MTIDPKLLDCLVKFFIVAHHENAGKAANKAGWSRAKLSRRRTQLLDEIQRANDGELQLPELFKAGTSEPTEQGRALYDWLLPQVAALCDVPMMSPRLRVGASHFILKNFARDLVVEFHKIRPDVILDFSELRAGRVFERLDKREIDLGIGPEDYPTAAGRADYVRCSSGQYTLRHQLIINARLWEEQGVPLEPTWSELVRLPWIAYRKGTATRHAIDHELRGADLSWVPVCEIEDEDIMRQLVDAQPRVAIVSVAERDGKLLPGTRELQLPPMPEVVLKLFRSGKKTPVEEAFAATLWRCLNSADAARG